MKAVFVSFLFLLTALPWVAAQGEVQERHFMLARDPDQEKYIEDLGNLLGREEGRAAAMLLKKITTAPLRNLVYPRDLDRSLGLFSRLRKVISQAPAAGIEELEQALAPVATPILTRALTTWDRNALVRITNHYPATTFARQAMLALAGMAMEQGKPVIAAAWYRRTRESFPNETRAKLGLELCQRLVKETARKPLAVDSSKVGGGIKPTALDQLFTQMAPLFQNTSPWPDLSGNGHLMSTPPSRLGQCWSLSYSPQGINNLPNHVSRYPYHPVTDGSAVYLCLGSEAFSWDVFSRRVRWWHREKLNHSGRDQGNPGQLISCPVLAGALSPDLFICPLQIGTTGADKDFRSWVKISSSLPIRRLFAFRKAAQHSKPLWSHRQAKMDPNWTVAGPPLVRDGKIYVTCAQYGQTVLIFACCYEAATGKELWKTRICSGQLQLNMFGNTIGEYTASPLACHEGIIYGCTNLGANWSVEAATGEIRWLAFYNSRRPKDRNYITAMQYNQTRFLWANNPPLVCSDSVVFAPADSNYAMALGIKAGKRGWKLHHRQRVGSTDLRLYHILGRANKRIYFSGNGVLAIPEKPNSPTVHPTSVLIPPTAFPRFNPSQTPPRWGLGKNCIYTIDSGGQLNIWTLEGNNFPTDLIEDTPANPETTGNLVAVPGIIISAGPSSVHAIFSIDSILHRLRRNLARNPDNVQLLTDLAATLRRRAKPGDRREALALSIKALTNKALTPGEKETILTGLRHTARERIDILCNQGELAKALALAEKIARFGTGTASELKCSMLLANTLQRLKKWSTWTPLVVDILQRNIFKQASNPAHMAAQLLQGLTNHLQSTAKGSQEVIDLWLRLRHELNQPEFSQVARDAVAQLLEKHGRKIYQAVETRAATALETALKANDQAALQALVDDYPNSLAASKASHRLVEFAARQGDLTTVLKAVNRLARSKQDPAIRKPLALAAAKAGNPWLAQALGFELTSKKPGPPAPHRGRLQGKPFPGGYSLKLAPGRSSNPGNHLLRPIRWTTDNQPLPILIAQGGGIRALAPSIKSEELKRRLWYTSIPGTVATNQPCFLFGQTLVLLGSRGIYRIRISDGKLLSRSRPGKSFTLHQTILFTVRHGLVITAYRQYRSPEIMIHVMEPTTGATWGETRYLPEPGQEWFLFPGPEAIYPIFFKTDNPGDFAQTLVEIQKFNPLTMQTVTLTGPWQKNPMPLSTPLKTRYTAFANGRLVLPLLKAGGQAGLRILPLAGKGKSFDIDFPKGERLLQATCSMGRLITLNICHETNGNLRHFVRLFDAEKPSFPLWRAAVDVGRSARTFGRPADGDEHLTRSTNRYALLAEDSGGKCSIYVFHLDQKDVLKTSTMRPWGSIAPLPRPLMGDGILLAMAPSDRAINGPAPHGLYFIDTDTGRLITSLHGLLSSGMSAQMSALPGGLIVAVSGNQLRLVQTREVGR